MADHDGYSHSAYPIDRTSRAVRPLRVCIIAANDFRFDSRFRRSAFSLADDGHDVTVAALAGEGLPKEERLAPHVRLIRLDLDRRLSAALRPLPEGLRHACLRAVGLSPSIDVLPASGRGGAGRAGDALRRSVEILANIRRVGPWRDAVMAAAPRTDVFHCQSLVVLPVAASAATAQGAALVYDVADYHTEAERLARMPWLVRETVRRRERRWARRAASLLAVSDPVADLVAHRWRTRRPDILLNCPPAWRPGDTRIPASSRIAAAIGVDDDRPIVLYQGGLSIERGIEELLAAAETDGFRDTGAALVLMGYGRLEATIRRMAAASRGWIHVLPAVPPDELLEWTASADVSFVGQPPRTLNWKLNLPNKLFESLMAGVPVVVSRGNEQCRLVSAERVGLCVDPTPEPIATAIARLLSASKRERLALRRHCRQVALARYTWEANAGGLVDSYRRLAAGQP